MDYVISVIKYKIINVKIIVKITKLKGVKKSLLIITYANIVIT